MRAHAALPRFKAIRAVVWFLLLFSPIPFSHPFAEGLTIPFVFLIVHILVTYWRTHTQTLWRKQPMVIALIFAIIFLTAPASRTVTLYRFFTKPAHIYFYYPDAYPLIYLDPDRFAVFEKMAQEPVGSTRVLAGILNNQLIPGETGQISYAGHWAET